MPQPKVPLTREAQSLGGQNSRKNLSPERTAAIAKAAGIASGAARRKKAKQS